jgi:hypothetical protein
VHPASPASDNALVQSKPIQAVILHGFNDTFESKSCRSAMPSRSDITYFGAGPAPLSTDVLEEAAKALLNYNATGLGGTELPEALITPSSIFREAS